MRRSWKIVLALIVAGTLVGGATRFIFDVIEVGVAAERQTNSITYLTEATTTFIKIRREWPRSWKDLESVRPSVGMVRLPGDLAWIEDQVVVDFDADIHQIAAQTPRTFTGFKPREDPYYNYPNWYAQVIEAARQIEAETKPEGDIK